MQGHVVGLICEKADASNEKARRVVTHFSLFNHQNLSIDICNCTSATRAIWVVPIYRKC